MKLWTCAGCGRDDMAVTEVDGRLLCPRCAPPEPRPKRSPRPRPPRPRKPRRGKRDPSLVDSH